MPKKQITKNEMMKNVKRGYHLQALRLAKGLKASWVADKMGVSGSMVCYLETGRRKWSDDLEQKFMKAIGEV